MTTIKIMTTIKEFPDMERFWVLEEKTPRRVCVQEYSNWERIETKKSGKSPRLLFNDKFGEGIEISTVFLMLDHSWGGNAPVLFETMVFGGGLDQEQIRYCTYDEAEAGHKIMCERVFKSLQGYPNEQSSSGN